MISATQILRAILFSVSLFIPIASEAQLVSAQTYAAQVVIYQIQTGAVSSASQEYISLYNNSSQPADITNWCVTYASASDISQTQLSCVKSPSAGTKLFLNAYGYLVLATSEFTLAHPEIKPDYTFTAGLSATSGHIKLTDHNKELIDLAGWGAAVHPEGSAAIAPASGKILQRLATTDNQRILADSNNNLADFYHISLAIQAGGNMYEEVNPSEFCDISDTYCPVDSQLVLSELLPDAEGADSGKEFIEVFNPTNLPVNLAEYSFRIGPNFTQQFLLTEMVLEPNKYAAISDAYTKLTLPNTGATIRLNAPDDTVISEISYADISETAAYANIGGSWYETFQPTPGAENVLVASKPCEPGQVRSTDSGQCRTSLAAIGLQPCKAGQIRNLDTGRCRNDVNLAASTSLCKTGQEKNPATNRCRNIVVPASAKQCPAGQERNSTTGRCKKITALAASGTKSVKDVPSELITNNVKWWIVGAAIIATIGYALYEWRREVIGFVWGIKNKLAPG